MRRFVLVSAACLSALAQESPTSLVQRAASGMRYADGPAIAPGGAIVFTDAPNDRILRLAPGHPLAVEREKSAGATAIAFDSRHRMILCQAGARRVVRIEDNGATTVLASEFEGKPLNSPNDLALRPDGHLYFTDPAFGSDDDRRELPFHGVFHLTPKGKLEAVYRSQSRPNGIALSPNGRTLYVSFADERAIRAFDLDRQGAASSPRVLISSIEGVPAGLKTGAQGNIYAAAAALLIYSPAGKLLHETKLPETPSNLAIDAVSGAIYVTARTSLYRVHPGESGVPAAGP